MKAKQCKVEFERVKLKKKLLEEIISVKDLAYAMFKQGINEVIAQIKHFNVEMLINYSNVT